EQDVCRCATASISRKSYSVNLTGRRGDRNDRWPSLLCEGGRGLVGIAAAAREQVPTQTRGMAMLSTVLIVVLVLALIGALPTWPYSSGWGFYPSGGLGLVVLVLIVVAVTGRL